MPITSNINENISQLDAIIERLSVVDGKFRLSSPCLLALNPMQINPASTRKTIANDVETLQETAPHLVEHLQKSKQILTDPANAKDAEFLESIWLRIKQSAEICANAAKDGVSLSRFKHDICTLKGSG